MTIENSVTLKCETTSIQELETYPVLERDYKRYRGGYCFEYKGKPVFLVINFLIEDRNNKSNIIFYVAFQIIGKYLLFINCLLSIT